MPFLLTRRPANRDSRAQNTLRYIAEAAGADSTLQGLVEAELASGVSLERRESAGPRTRGLRVRSLTVDHRRVLRATVASDGKTAICSLLWLQRALYLIQVMLAKLLPSSSIPFPTSSIPFGR